MAERLQLTRTGIDVRLDTAESTDRPASTGQTRRLLASAIAAGPLFLGVALSHAFLREGFDLAQHPISLLSVGDLGWIQIANFVVAGTLVVLAAVGMRRVLRGPGSTWGPICVAAFGAGLVAGGVFVTDPGAGFPPGAPQGAPEELTWHGLLHNVAAILGFNAMTLGCFVFARRFAVRRQWRWLTAALGSAAIVIALTWWPDMNGISVRLVLATAVLFAFIAAVAAQLIRELEAAADRTDTGVVTG